MTTEIPRCRTELGPLLDSYGLAPSRRRGQCFLVDPALADALVVDARVRPGDRVVEIGPGAGALTQPLLELGAHVTAVELDRGLHQLLLDHLGDHPSLELIHGDALAGTPDGSSRLHPAVIAALARPSENGEQRLVVSNLPYSVGTAVVSALLDLDEPPDRIVAMLQKEVVEKLLAHPGERAWGPLAVDVASSAEGRVLRRVPRQVFLPRPKVESVVFELVPRRTGRPDAGLRSRVRDLTHAAFGGRRKTLRRTLGGRVSEQSFAEAGVDPTTRPQEVSGDQWVALARAVESHG